MLLVFRLGKEISPISTPSAPGIAGFSVIFFAADGGARRELDGFFFVACLPLNAFRWGRRRPVANGRVPIADGKTRGWAFEGRGFFLNGRGRTELAKISAGQRQVMAVYRRRGGRLDFGEPVI